MINCAPAAAQIMKLVTPGLDHLPDYRAALERDWSPDNVRGVVAAREELTKISADPAAFVASLDDVEAKGEPVRLPDGTTVPRLPGYRRWMWDDGFCGAIGFRWRPGGSSLPPHVLGHIGYAVVPWRRISAIRRSALDSSSASVAARVAAMVVRMPPPV